MGKARCMAHRLSATASLDSAACGPLAQGAASPGTPAGKHCRSLHCELCGASAHEVTGKKTILRVKVTQRALLLINISLKYLSRNVAAVRLLKKLQTQRSDN